MADDEVGHAGHPGSGGDRRRHRMPLDGEAESLEQGRGDLAVASAVARRVVAGNADELAQEFDGGGVVRVDAGDEDGIEGHGGRVREKLA